MGPRAADQVETEVKLQATGPEAARAAVLRLGARMVGERALEDNLLLDDAAASLASSGRALRIRRTGGRSIVTFKGPRTVVDGVRSRPEVETEVPDGDALQAILAGVGFAPRFRYQKYRETWTWRDVEIVVDETPIGTFLEIEGPVEGIHAAAQALGYGPADYVSESYASLFFASGGRGDMVFPPG